MDDHRHFGQQTENIFYYAIDTLPEAQRPAWFLDFREATYTEDLNGADFFACLDVGPAKLQVKSSEAGLWKYVSMYPHEDAIVIVVTPRNPPSDIRSRTLSLLGEWRDIKLRCMPRWKPMWGPIANFAYSPR